MSDNPQPVILELAPLPREQIGPFLLLGVDKDATPEQIDAAWAERLKRARKGQQRIGLEDVNWARKVINDPERRIRADVTSLNLDTADGVLRRLAEHYGLTQGPTWRPVDQPRTLADYSPAIDVPDPSEVLQAVTPPELPLELPILPQLLAHFVPTSLDPWSFDLGDGV